MGVATASSEDLTHSLPSPLYSLSNNGTSPTESNSTSSSQFRSVNRRNSILTIASIATALPRYSTIDLTDTRINYEQVDHCTELDETPPPSLTSDVSPSLQLTYDEGDHPPEYSPVNSNPERPRSRRPNFMLHKFHIGGVGGNTVGLGKGKSSQEPWATLKLLSRAALPGSKKRIPRFIGGDILRGCVDLRLDSPMTVHKIKLIVSVCLIVYLEVC